MKVGERCKLIKESMGVELQTHKTGTITKYDPRDDTFLVAWDGSTSLWVSSGAIVGLYSDALMSTKNNIDEFVKRGLSEIKDYQARLSNATSIQEFMQLKRDLLITMTRRLPPLKENHCVFCIENSTDCGSCGYGIKYGKCKEPTSRYYDLSTELSTLIRELEEYY